MNSITEPIDRIVEPFAKAAFAKWLVRSGARRVLVSIDGMEPRANEFPNYLSNRFEFVRNPRSRTTWAGVYRQPSSVIETHCMPGIDIQAEFEGGALWVAECKGETTASGVKSGGDLTNIYCCLGQLLALAGKMLPLPDRRFLVLPESNRLRETMQVLAGNPLLDAAGIELAEIDRFGRVTTVPRICHGPSHRCLR
jgi:hypothetical protein